MSMAGGWARNNHCAFQKAALEHLTCGCTPFQRRKDVIIQHIAFLHVRRFLSSSHISGAYFIVLLTLLCNSIVDFTASNAFYHPCAKIILWDITVTNLTDIRGDERWKLFIARRNQMALGGGYKRSVVSFRWNSSEETAPFMARMEYRAPSHSGLTSARTDWLCKRSACKPPEERQRAKPGTLFDVSYP